MFGLFLENKISLKRLRLNWLLTLLLGVNFTIGYSMALSTMYKFMTNLRNETCVRIYHKFNVLQHLHISYRQVLVLKNQKQCMPLHLECTVEVI